MRNRIPAATALVVAMLASIAALSGCGSSSGAVSDQGSGRGAQASSPAANQSGTPTRSSAPVSSGPVMGGGASGAVPNIPVVRLGTSFSPKTLRLGAGQKFVVIVSSSDKVTGSGISGACNAATAARFSSDLLSLSCQGNSYMYTTRRAGSTELSVTVRPNCKTGAMCPQWMATSTLDITVSGS